MPCAICRSRADSIPPRVKWCVKPCDCGRNVIRCWPSRDELRKEIQKGLDCGPASVLDIKTIKRMGREKLAREKKKSLLCQSSLRDGGGAESTRYLVVHSHRLLRDADRFLDWLVRQCQAWREAADGAESAHAHGRDRKWNIGAAVLTADIWLT